MEASFYICLTVSSQRKQPAREYIDSLEDLVSSVAKKFKRVRLGVSSAEEGEDGTFTESFGISAEKEATIEELAETLIAEVRSGYLKGGYTVGLRKRIASKWFDRPIWSGKVSKWTAAGSATNPAKAPKKGYPPRIQYLAELAEKYYGAGGSDLYGIFSEKAEIRPYLQSLLADETNKLREIYLQIGKHDADWIMDWLLEDESGRVTLAKAHTIYFLAFLDRLRAGGLAVGQVRRLVDWTRIS